MSNKVPQIRFNGYSDAWEERKLGEVSKYSNGGSYENDVVENGTYELITLKSVNMSGKLVSSGKFINRETKTLEKDTLVMILSEQAPGLLGMTAKIPENNRYVLNQRVAEIKPNTNIDSYFLSMSINRSQAYFSKRGAGTKVQNISKPNVENFEFYCPSEREQQKIGSFFKHLDDTIALHQRKLDLLKEQKKGYLQKMFPKNGAKVPELRFAGFADDWEERKFGELLKEFSIKSQIEDEYNVLSSTNSGMEFREGRVSGTSNLGYKIIKNGDLVLSPQNLWLGNININNIGKGLVSPSYKTFEFRNIDSSFINPQLRTQKMLEEYKNSSTQGASVVRRNLEIDSFYQIKIFVPTIAEQEKIGSFFKQLDNTIALHQRKLDLLKEQKAGFLQRMFV